MDLHKKKEVKLRLEDGKGGIFVHEIKIEIVKKEE